METLKVFDSGRIICECRNNLWNKDRNRISDCSHSIDFAGNIEHLEEKGYQEVA